MIIVHFHLQPQFIYELFHINFTSITITLTLTLTVTLLLTLKKSTLTASTQALKTTEKVTIMERLTLTVTITKKGYPNTGANTTTATDKKV